MSKERARRRAILEQEKARRAARRERAERRRALLRRMVPRSPRRRTGKLFARRTRAQRAAITAGVLVALTLVCDPIEAALAWQRQGAEWIHLVDLDAAFGRGSNATLLAKVVRKLDVAVELSGGIRDDASLKAALSTGATRVNLGTAALENPDWCDHVCATYGERVAVGLDVRGHQLAARGWTREGGDLFEVLARLDGGQRRRVEARRPAPARRARAGWRGGRDRRQGALRGGVLRGGGPRGAGGGTVSELAERTGGSGAGSERSEVPA